MENLINRLEQLLVAKFAEAAFADCFLLEVRVQPGNRIEVFVDADRGITLDQCKHISRYLERYLDQEGWAGDTYVLEVSSPGVDRPLMLRRQYPKHIGRFLALTLASGERCEGKLMEVSDSGVVLEVQEASREHAAKKKKMHYVKKMRTVAFDEITEAKVQVRF